MLPSVVDMVEMIVFGNLYCQYSWHISRLGEVAPVIYESQVPKVT